MAPHLEGPQRPKSIHAETTVLGAILVEPSALYEAFDSLVTTDFSLDSHRRIYAAILELEEEGTPVDIVTLAEKLRSKKEIDAIGGVPYLAELSEGIPRKLSIRSYVNIIRQKSIARQGMDTLNHFYTEMGDDSQEIHDVMSRLQNSILEIESGKNDHVEHVGYIGERVVAEIAEQRKITSEDSALGYTYGIEGIDVATKGAYSGEYSVILGETNSGKTAWLGQIMVDNALKGIPCHLFSMEMTRESMYKRLISPLSKIVTATQIRDPRMMFMESFDDFRETSRILDRLPIVIDDSRQLPLDQLIARAKSAIRKDGAKLILIDYLQLIMPSASKKNATEITQVTDATLGLRDLAASHIKDGVHVIALSQYSRPMDGGRGRPSNHRARGSGAIEHSCQVMMHIVRDEDEEGRLQNNGEIRIGKLREGQRGTVRVELDPNHLRLKNQREEG